MNFGGVTSAFITLMQNLIKLFTFKPIKMNSQQLYDEILHPVNCQYGAPMGRPNKGQIDPTKRVFDREVKLYDLAYDKGGAYWGCGEPLRVAFQEGYTEFYRGPKRLYKRVNGCLVRQNLNAQRCIT